ncbi:phage Gp37/Gp68 family protein [Bradyrhizobium barranii subsp. apii]|uniref:phage Gp37/Gp68 family protein n=1 Tax=Bradyrhizobium barranii TaxID=2992140 RepID=UPI001AA1034B|nr:phage Gp37/Gp68 family protein [Bradyrhizobium barranii]UPT93921.1 phage Gp37/Gp68 family protein [Bradyrhizobium barranii subsp. apii]
MSDHSMIEWTDATWNPITGCSIHSPGCINCYAMDLAGTRLKNHPSRVGLTKDSKTGPVWTGEVRFNEGWLTQPLHWRKPRMVFVCAHGDLFHEDVPDAWIDRVFAVMALAPQHTFQVLTKRAKRMREYLDHCEASGRIALLADELWGTHIAPGSKGYLHEHVTRDDEGLKDVDIDLNPWPLPNVWLGVSAERQQEANERIPELLAAPAAIRFVSLEPLLDHISLHALNLGTPTPSNALRGVKCVPDDSADGFHNEPTPKLDWVIVGGESGDRARPMHPDTARSLRDWCQASRVAFFFKQWGEYLPVGQSLPDCGKVHGATAVKPGRMKLHYGGSRQHAPKYAFAEHGVEIASTDDGRLTYRVGKKKAGRLLDGVEHNGMPEKHSA